MPEKTKYKVLDFIKNFNQKNGFPPTVREICDGLGIKSSSTIHGHLKRLKRDNFIDYNPTLSRTVRVIDEQEDIKPTARKDAIKFFTAKHVAKTLCVSSATIANYSRQLEKDGYQFLKNHVGYRLFTNEDIKLLERKQEEMHIFYGPNGRITNYRKTRKSNENVNLTIDEELLKRIDEFRTSKRKLSRSKAVRKLLQYAFQCMDKKE